MTNNRTRKVDVSNKTLEVKIARLRQEMEQLSAQHNRQLRLQASTNDRRTRELQKKRARILEQRVQKLGEMLRVLLRLESNPHSSETARETMVAAHGS